MLEAVQPAASAQADFHLVHDDPDAVLATTFLQSCEKAWWWNNQAAIRHQGLNEYCGNLTGRTCSRELVVEQFEYFFT